MAANYQVHLTATAEKDYETFYNQAETDVDEIETHNQRVALLASIDRAIDETLSTSPINVRRTLAGCLSFVFMLNLGSICVYYIAYAEHGNVYVLHIGPNQEGVDLTWLHEAVANGEAEELLETLGIEKGHLLEDVPEAWLN